MFSIYQKVSFYLISSLNGFEPVLGKPVEDLQIFFSRLLLQLCSVSHHVGRGSKAKLNLVLCELC